MIARMAMIGAGVVLGAAGGTLDLTAPGTVQGDVVVAKSQSNPQQVCMVHAMIDPNGAQFDNLGPSISLYRRDTAGGQVAITLPRVAHGLLTTTGSTTVASFDYVSLGSASLDFTTQNAGTVTFIGGGNVLPNGEAAPTFQNYKETWHKGTNQLGVHMIFKMAGCQVPVAATYQF